MRLPTVEYLRWARLRKETEYDLSRSEMGDLPLENLGVTPDRLLLDEGFEWGSRAIRNVVASSYSLPDGNVLPVHGTTFGVFLVCATLLERGDRVLVEDPSYEPLRRIPLFFGAKIDRLPRPYEKGYRFDRQALLDNLHSDTRLMILTDPHNPSGVRLSREERDWIGAVAEAEDVDVLVDEIYQDFQQIGGEGKENQAFNMLFSMGAE